VKTVEHGAVNSSVTLDLGGGILLSSIITERSTTELGLKEGDEACTMFKASSVILAVEG
jgi:molybdate transport system regulatory protein